MCYVGCDSRVWFEQIRGQCCEVSVPLSRVSSPGIFVAPAGCLPAHWTAETSPSTTPIAVMLLLIAESTTTSSRVVGVETGRLVAERVLVIATIKVVIGASVKAAASFVGVTSCGIPAKISAADTPSFLVLPGIVTALLMTGIVHVLRLLRRAVGVALAVIMSLLLRRWWLSGQVLHRVVDVVVVLRKPFVVLLGRSHLTGG